MPTFEDMIKESAHAHYISRIQTREHKHEKKIVRTLIFQTVLYGF